MAIHPLACRASPGGERPPLPPGCPPAGRLGPGAAWRGRTGRISPWGSALPVDEWLAAEGLSAGGSAPSFHRPCRGCSRQRRLEPALLAVTRRGPWRQDWRGAALARSFGRYPANLGDMHLTRRPRATDFVDGTGRVPGAGGHIFSGPNARGQDQPRPRPGLRRRPWAATRRPCCPPDPQKGRRPGDHRDRGVPQREYALVESS